MRDVFRARPSVEVPENLRSPHSMHGITDEAVPFAVRLVRDRQEHFYSAQAVVGIHALRGIAKSIAVVIDIESSGKVTPEKNSESVQLGVGIIMANKNRRAAIALASVRPLNLVGAEHSIFSPQAWIDRNVDARRRKLPTTPSCCPADLVNIDSLPNCGAAKINVGPPAVAAAIHKVTVTVISESRHDRDPAR